MAKKYPLEKDDAKYRAELSDAQYNVLREKGTEPPFSGKYWNHKGDGIYVCGGCATTLFESDSKFDSGCGWPSFYEPADQKVIEEQRDASLGMVRTEVLCNQCGSHLGHVFDDAPSTPTGLRYCINSLAVDFKDRTEG